LAQPESTSAAAAAMPMAESEMRELRMVCLFPFQLGWPVRAD
jgi:hypothetical protein